MAQQPPVNGTIRLRPGRRNSLRQAVHMQQVLYESIVGKGDTKLADGSIRSPTLAEKAQAARAWEALEDRKRILRGRPLPGNLKPVEHKQKRKPHSLTPTEEP